MDGWVNRWIDGWINRWMDRWLDKHALQLKGLVYWVTRAQHNIVPDSARDPKNPLPSSPYQHRGPPSLREDSNTESWVWPCLDFLHGSQGGRRLPHSYSRSGGKPGRKGDSHKPRLSPQERGILIHARFCFLGFKSHSGTCSRFSRGRRVGQPDLWPVKACCPAKGTGPRSGAVSSLGPRGVSHLW